MKKTTKIFGLGALATFIIGVIDVFRRRRTHLKELEAQDRMYRACEQSKTAAQMADEAKEIEALIRSKLRKEPLRLGESPEEWANRVFEGEVEIEKELEIDP